MVLSSLWPHQKLNVGMRLSLSPTKLDLPDMQLQLSIKLITVQKNGERHKVW